VLKKQGPVNRIKKTRSKNPFYVKEWEEGKVLQEKKGKGRKLTFGGW